MADNTARIPKSNAGVLKYLLKGSLFLFILGILANAVFTFLSTLTPQVISFAINYVISDDPVPPEYGKIVSLAGGIENLKNNMWILAVVLGVIAVLSALFHFSGLYLNAQATQKFMQRTRNGLFTHVQRLPLSTLSAHRTGDIIQRCTSDVQTVSNFVSNQLVSLFRIVILIIFSLTFMFLMNVKLALIAGAFIPVFIVWGYIFQRLARKHFRKCDEEEGVLSNIAQENFTGARVIRAFGREKSERDKFETQNVYYTGLWLKILRKLTAYWTANNLVAGLQGILIVVTGTVFCIKGELSTGDFVAFISYNVMLMTPVRELGRIISRMSATRVSLSRISEVLCAGEEEYGTEEILSGGIEFKDVNFSYEEGKPVLSGINFTVAEGTTLGIVGSAGSGKSTLAMLLAKLYPLSGGDILIGGKSFSDISISTLRSNIGLILQDGYIYSATVGENIAITDENADKEKITEYARLACVDGNIEGFANGYDTVVGERGVTLSGGQKQRIAIARTLMRRTPYIIFDDSLSAVDSETDAEIRSNLKEHCAGSTVIIISHRITTVMHADKIIVLDGGKIAEEGTHTELLEKQGIYSRIYDIQLSLPEELSKEAENG